METELPLPSRIPALLRRIARAAFFALIILIPFRISVTLAQRPVGNIYADYTDFLLFITDIVLLLILVSWLAAKALSREPFRRPPWLITVPLAAFILFAGLSVIGSIDPALSAYHLLRIILLTGLVFYIADQLDSIESLFPALALQVGIQSFVAIGQFLRQTDLGFQRLGEYFLNPDWPGISIVFDTNRRWLRAYGLSDHPNILGGCLAFALILLLGAHLRAESDGRRAPAWLFPVYALGSLALFYTFSRSAWLALVLAGVFLLVRSLRTVGWRRVAPSIVMLALVLAAMSPFVFANLEILTTRLPLTGREDISPTELQAIGERAILNDAGVSIFMNFPILGAGLGVSPLALRAALPDFTLYYQPAHLVFIAAAAETGLLGVTAYFFLLAAPWFMLVASRRLRAAPDAWVAASGLLAVAVVGFFDYYPWLLQPGRLWQFLLLGLFAVAARPPHLESGQ